MILFHICSADDWASAVARGVYEPASLQSEGFVHCSTGQQYLEVAHRLFAGRDDLVLLGIDASELRAEVRLEAADDDVYPHVYGPIELRAVFDVSPLRRTDETFEPPDDAEGFELFGGRTLDDARALASRTMGGFEHPWWVLGGWAIDLALGRKTRPHADLEVGVLRAAVPALFAHLRGRDMRLVVGAGRLQPWDGEAVPDDVHQIWTRAGSGRPETWQEFARDPTMVDVLIDDGDGTTWRSRRYPSITLPVERVGLVDDDGIPYIKPEIQLLYKAKSLRWKDERDFARAVPVLDPPARTWLRDALAIAYGSDHPWIARLRAHEKGASEETP